MYPFEAGFMARVRRIGEDFLPTDNAIFRSNPDGLQGRATQYVSKKTVQTAYNGYEDGFQTLWEGKAVWTG